MTQHGPTASSCPPPNVHGVKPGEPGGPGPGGGDDPLCVEVMPKPGADPIPVVITGNVDVTLNADQLAELTAGLQAIVDAIVDIGTLEDLEVTITNDPLTVTIDGDVDVDFGPLTDWLADNNLTVTIDGGTVTVDGTVSIDPDDLQALLDALADLSADLVAAIDVAVDDLEAALQAVVDAIADLSATLEGLLESILDELQDLCVSIQNKPGETLEVEVTNLADIPIGIEAALAPVGWTCDDDGKPNGGRLFLCKVVDEATGAETHQIKYWDQGLGDTPVPYDPATHGDFCPPEVDEPRRYTYHECRKDPKTGAKGDLIVTVDLDAMTCAEAWKIDGAIQLEVPPGLLSCDCTVTNLTGCDQTLNDDGETYTQVQAPVYIRITDCPGQPREILAFTDLEQTTPYTIQGELFDEACENLLEFPAAKPQGEIVSERTLAVDMTVGLVDNNAGIPTSTGPIYHYGDTRTHETVLGGGATVTWVQIPTAGWSPQFAGGDGWLDTDRPDSFLMAWAAAVDPNATVANGGIKVADDGFSATVGNCTMQIGCGTSPGGCGGFPGLHPDVAATGAKVFARHVSFVCCSPEFIPASTTVIATDNAAGPRAPIGHVQDNQLTTVTIKFREITVCLEDGTLDTYLVDNCGNIIDPRTIPPCDCWKACPVEVTGTIDTGLPVGPSECANSESGDCECAITTANFDPDQGSQWDQIAISNGVMTVSGTPTGSFHEQMLGTNPQCEGDLWLCRYGAYDGAPGAGSLLAEGYILASLENASGDDYTLGAPGFPSPCGSANVEQALVDAGFTATEAASLIANGYATVDVFNTAGATHINGVFDNQAPTPFGVCISLDDSECDDEEPKPDVLFTEDRCLNDKLDQLIALQIEANAIATANGELLAQIAGCLCGCGKDCVPSCAHAIGGLPAGGQFEISEGGITWTICGESITVGAGNYSWQAMADAITAGFPNADAEVVGVDPQAIVVHAPDTCCDAGDVQFQIGDDAPVQLVPLPDQNRTCEDDEDGPLGDQTICATRKMGADFVSNASGSGTHTAGTLYDTNGPVDSWTGTFTVTDSAGNTHTFNDGDTVTGLAPGSTQSVTFTGTVEWTHEDGTKYRCPVDAKPISASFQVQA